MSSENTLRVSPTRTRLLVAAVLTVAACLLYLDRFAVGIASEEIRKDLNMSQKEMAWFLSAFFWSYALFQVPAGWFSDRMGPRRVLTFYIVGWSAFTAMIGKADFVWQAILLRLLFGAFQAGAYPVCSGLIRSWFPVDQRGKASAVVSLGGRSGAILAPILTASLMAVDGISWRGVLMSYGIAGLVVAGLCYWICYNKPYQHPWSNDAERRLIDGETPSTFAGEDSGGGVPVAVIGFPWKGIVTSISLWGNCAVQFCTNIGWLFVVTWLPRYLGDVHQVPLKEQALMTAAPTAAGVAGMIFGGWYTDRAARKYGTKWGRRIPVMVTRFVAAFGYLFCYVLGTWFADAEPSRWLPWLIVSGLCLATFSCDLGIPAIWAYAQDVGGPFTASVMGWGNMFGNFGAAIAPLIYNAILGEAPSVQNWNQLFAMCCGIFLIAGAASLTLDSTRSIIPASER